MAGEVGTLAAKNAAERDAYNTLGVRRVINNLKVKSRNWPGDLEVTRRVEEAINRDSHLTNYELHPSSHFGKLYVSGEVNTHFDKSRIDAVLADVPGVREIVNRTSVDAVWKEKADEEILEDSNRRLNWSPFLDPEQIAVTVDDGVVTLSGKVDTWHEQKAATRHAYQAGARRVRNKLNVTLGREFPANLKATLVPNRASYVIAAEHAGEEFRKFLTLPLNRERQLPSAPEVDLTLNIINEGDSVFEFRLGHDVGGMELSLVGEGAVHVPIARPMTADSRMGAMVAINPNEAIEIPITNLS